MPHARPAFGAIAKRPLWSILILSEPIHIHDGHAYSPERQVRASFHFCANGLFFSLR
jgi:hypothetical protein